MELLYGPCPWFGVGLKPLLYQLQDREPFRRFSLPRRLEAVLSDTRDERALVIKYRLERTEASSAEAVGLLFLHSLLMDRPHAQKTSLSLLA